MDAETIKLITTLIGNGGLTLLVVIIVFGCVMVVIVAAGLLLFAHKFGYISKGINAIANLRQTLDILVKEVEKNTLETERSRIAREKCEIRQGELKP